MTATTPITTPTIPPPQAAPSAFPEDYLQFSQKLDLLLKPLAKRCRYALPIPSHLANEEGVHMLDSMIATKNSTGSSEARGKDIPDALAVATALAQEQCEGQVPHLAVWRTRVRGARQNGEKCLSEIQQLTKHVQAIRDVTHSVREQSDLLSSNASSLMVRKARLERVQAMLQESIAQYNKVEDLAREAAHPMLSASSTRFSIMLEEIEDVMQFLSNNVSYKSSKQYALKLALSQQRALQCLKDGLCSSINGSHNEVMGSPTFAASFYDKNRATAARGLIVQTGMEQAQQPPGSESHSGSADVLDTRGLKPTVAVLNASLLQKLDSSSPLRRIAEARCAALQEDIHLQDLLSTYRDARTRLICPVLRDHLVHAIARIEAGEDSSTRLRSLTSLCVTFTRDVLEEEKQLFESVWVRDDIVSTFDQLAAEIGEEAYHIFRSNLLAVDNLDALAFASDVLSSFVSTEGVSVPSSSGSYQEVSALAKRMSQDIQERVIFRTSVYIRTVIAPQSISVDDCKKTLLAAPDAPVEIHPLLKNCEYLLSMLYPTVEKSVFTVFAEESIHLTLTHLSRFVKMAADTNVVAHCALQARLLHLRHLLRLRAHISRFDASFIVVEKALDLSQLAQRKLEILQSSREAKRDIESEMKVVCEDIVQLMGNAVLTQLRKLSAEPSADGNAVAVAAADAATALDLMQSLLVRFIESPATRSVLIRPITTQLADLQILLKTTATASETSTEAEPTLPATQLPLESS